MELIFLNKQAEFSIDDIFGDSLNLKLDEEFNIPGVEEEPEQEKSKLIKVHEDGIYIQSDELLEEIKKKNLSASLVSSFRQCPADWLLDSFVLPKLKHIEPIHFVRGKAFHSAMEEFFVLPKEQRTRQVLSQIAYKVIKEKYKVMLDDLESMNWMKNALLGYLDGGFEYENVELAQIPKKKDGILEPGIELFVKGKIGNTKRNFVGFVDRVDRLPDGSLQIVDYKTGKKISPFDPTKPIDSNNSFDYWRQQLAYTMILENDGYYIGGAKLEFPVAKGTVTVDIRNEHLRKQVERDFEEVDAALDKCIEERFFPFNGHFFCKWCGMLSPKHQVSRYGSLNLSTEEVNLHIELL